MMGERDAEIFLSSRLSNANILRQDRGSVRYLSNVSESLKQLKSLNTFKEKGRWELVPKNQEKDEYYNSDPEYGKLCISEYMHKII
jgi:N-acyl-L-homoserine lactone synthetase